MSDIMPLPSHIRGLIFDCDGTLVDTPAIYLAAWTEGLKHSGIVPPPSWYHGRAGLSEQALLDEFEAEHGITVARDEVIARMREAYHENLHRLEEIAAVTEIARAWAGKLPMAVASSGPGPNVRAALRVTGLDALFPVVVTIEDVAAPKPAPDLFLEAARRLRLAPASCLVFEDSRQGLEAAARAGMEAVDITKLA